MKKKLFSFVLAFAFILTGAICLTACGGNKNAGVDMFGKTYTFSTTATYSMTENGNEVADWEQWITNNFDKIYLTYKHEKETAEELIAYLKSGNFVTTYSASRNVTVFKGAKIEIGAGTKTGDGNRKKGSFKVTLEDGSIINDIDVTAYSQSGEYNEYWDGSISGNGSVSYIDIGKGFDLTDYDVKDGTIRDASVYFFSQNNDVQYFYTNTLDVYMSTTMGTTVYFYITYSLASVN